MKQQSNIIRNRSITFFVYILLWFFLWIIAGCNTQNADLLNYYNYYTRNFVDVEVLDLADPGFNYLNKLFNDCGISFELYHMILYGLLLFFVSFQIWKRSKRPILISLIYIFTAYFADVIQLRNFLALLFLMLGLFAIVDKNEKYPKFKFFIWNLLASSIHITFVFYFVFLLVDIKFRPSFIIIGSILLSFLGHSILANLSVVPYIANNPFLSYRAETYMESSSYWSILICTVQYLLHYYVCKICVANTSCSIIDKNRLMSLVVLTSILLVMSSVNMTVFRLFRNLLLFMSIYLINFSLYCKSSKLKFWLLSYFLLMSYAHFWSTDVLKNVGIIFSHNFLW